jgi:hypothetical protein
MGTGVIPTQPCDPEKDKQSQMVSAQCQVWNSAARSLSKISGTVNKIQGTGLTDALTAGILVSAISDQL